MNCPLVTVYITNYNYERFIKRAVESVLSQTCNYFELIIIDDGSSDHSLEIIHELIPKAKQDLGENNVKLITQKNMGLNRSNNIALELARGKYLVRLDADDYFDPRAIEVMTNTLEKNPELGIVFPDYYLIDESDNILNLYRRNNFQDEVSLYDRPAHGACTMIRTDFLKKSGGYNEAFNCQDGFDLWLKMISKHQVENIGLPLFYYRSHGKNLSQNQEKIYISRGKILNEYLKNEGLRRLRTLAVIPIRGKNIGKDFLPLSILGGKEMLRWSLDSALKCSSIDEIIISCESIELIDLLKSRQTQNNQKKIHWHLRSEELAKANKDITDTLVDIDQNFESLKAQAYCILYVKAPFRDERYIEQMVDTLSFYPVDCVDGVVNDNSFFYKHNGNGLAPINQHPFFQFERDDIFKRAGGIHIVKKEFLKSGKKLHEGKTGHMLLDEKSAFYIRSKFDLEIACSLCRQEELNQSPYLRNSNEFKNPLVLS